MTKNIFQKSLLAIALGLILSIALVGVNGQFSAFASATIVSPSQWRLIVHGSNDNYLNLSLTDLEAMPKSTVNANLLCYGLLVSSGDWGGVNLGYLLNMAEIDQNTASIQFSAADGYTVTLPIEDAMQSNVIIAYERDNQSLPEVLRLVVPWANGNIWIGLVTSITPSSGVVSEPQSPNSDSPSLPTFPSQTQQSPATETKNQSTTAPVISPSNNQTQPASQQNSPASSLPVEYSYLTAFAIIGVAATTAGILIYKRRKKLSLVDLSQNKDTTQTFA